MNRPAAHVPNQDHRSRLRGGTRLALALLAAASSPRPSGRIATLARFPTDWWRQIQFHPAKHKGEDIAVLLSEAQADLDALRLTVPAGGNALEKYRKVLELAPDNAAARQGLQNIVHRLVGLGEQASAAGDLDKAADYLRQAEAIVPDAPNIALAKNKLALQKVAREREAAEAKEKQDRAEAVLRAVDAALAQDDAASVLARLEEARQAGVDEAVLAERRRRLRDRVETLAALAARDAKKALQAQDPAAARAAIKRARELKAQAEAVGAQAP